MKGKVNCTCGWSWNKSDSSAKDMYICHECGRDNSNNMKNGGWLDNYNDSQASAPEGMKGDGYSNVGRDYSPAWGGQFEEGGEIPMAQNGRATRADSLAVYNNAKKVEDYYKSKNYKLEKQDAFVSNNDPSRLKKILSDDESRFTKKQYNETSTGYDNILYFPSKRKIIKNNKESFIDSANPKNKEILKKIYNKKIDDNKLIQREGANRILNLDSPSQYFDLRIQPQSMSSYKDVSKNTLTSNDKVDIIKYDPLAVKPFDLLTDAEKKLRVEKYGTDGVPKSYLNKNKPTTTKQTTKPTKQNVLQKREPVEALKPLQPIGIENDFNIEATPLPAIIPDAKIPKSYDISTVFNSMKGPTTGMRFDNKAFNRKEASLEQVMQILEYADKYNANIQEKYGPEGSYYTRNSPRLEAVAADRANKIKLEVGVKPNYQMGGKLKSNIPVIEDAGGYNEDGHWVPDWEAMTAQAKKLGAKRVKTKHGSLIVFDDNWEVIGVDDNPDAMQMGGNVYPVNYVPQAQKGKRVNVSNYNTKLRKKEKDLIKKYVTPAQQRAQEIAVAQGINTGLHNGPLDAIRHSSSSAATSSILPSWANFIPGVAPLNILAANIAGAAHELNAPNNSLKEHASDLYNNFIGSVVGALPMSEKKKHELLIQAQKNNILSNLGDKTPLNKKPTAPQLPQLKLPSLPKRETGGSIPGATGSMYARVGAPSNGPYAKKTMASAQNGVDMYDNPMLARRVDNTNIDRSYYDPRLNTMNIGSDYNMWHDQETGELLTGDDLKYHQDKLLAHENYHAMQHKEGRDNYDIAHGTDNEQWARMQKRPELMSTNAVWNNFYNRSDIENQQDYQDMINYFPESRILNEDLLFDKVLDGARYNNPSNAEGEAKFYEDTGVGFRNGGWLDGYEKAQNGTKTTYPWSPGSKSKGTGDFLANFKNQPKGVDPKLQVILDKIKTKFPSTQPQPNSNKIETREVFTTTNDNILNASNEAVKADEKFAKGQNYEANVKANQAIAQRTAQRQFNALPKEEQERVLYEQYAQQHGNITQGDEPDSKLSKFAQSLVFPMTALKDLYHDGRVRNDLISSVWNNPKSANALDAAYLGTLGYLAAPYIQSGVTAAGSAIAPYMAADAVVGGTTLTGVNLGNIINAGFATQGAMNIGPDAKAWYNNPTSEGFDKMAWDTLEMLPVASPAMKTIGEGLSATKKTLGAGKGLFKYNPLATKIDDAASKIVGEGENSFIYDIAKPMYNRTFEAKPNFFTGYKQIKKPNQLDFSPIINTGTKEFEKKALENFKTLTGGKADDIDLKQFVDYFKAQQERENLKFQYQDFLTNINREKFYETPQWSNAFDDGMNQADDVFGRIEEQLLQKSSPLGKRLGSGAEGSVYELADDPAHVIKIGNTFKTNSADDLVKSFEGITDDNIARVLRAHKDDGNLIEIMPNLNVNPKFSNFTKEQVISKLEKDAKVLMDKGFRLDLDNINGNFMYNPYKNKVDIYDISKPAAGQTGQNPDAVLRFLRNHFDDTYKIPGTHPSYNPNMPTPEFKNGGIIKDDRGQWDHPGEITRISGGNITMKRDPKTGKALTQPILGIADTGEEQWMYPGEDYNFEGANYVTEYPKGKKPRMAKNGLRQEQKGLQNLDNLLNFTNYTKPQPGGWLSKYE